MMNHHRRFKSLFRSQVMAQHLVRRGHDVTLVVISDNKRFGIKKSKWEGVEIVETPDLLWGRLRSGWDVWNTLVRMNYVGKLKEDFDVMHIFETRPATIFPTLHYLKKRKIPLFIDWIDWWGGKGGLIDVARPKWYKYTLGSVESYFEEKYRHLADGTTVISTALGKRAEGLGIARESVLLLQGGVDADHFRSIDTSEARKRVGLDRDIKLLGFSSFDSYLDFKLLMEALLLVKKQMHEVKMLVTGKVTDSIKNIISSYGLENEVILTGFLPFDDLPIYLCCSDILLLPFPETLYNIGRWPNKIGDYMVVGRPVVTNPTGDLKTVFSDEKLGMTCDYTPEDFAEKILFLFRDEKKRNELGQNARQWAIKNLSWDKNILKLEEFYFKTLDEYSGVRIQNSGEKDYRGRSAAL